MATKPKAKNMPPWMKQNMNEDMPMPKRTPAKGKKPAKGSKKGC